MAGRLLWPTGRILKASFPADCAFSMRPVGQKSRPAMAKRSTSNGWATPSAYWAHTEASFSLRTHKCRLGGPYYEMSTMRLRVGTNEATLVKWNAFIVFSSMQVCKCIGKMSSVPSKAAWAW